MNELLYLKRFCMDCPLCRSRIADFSRCERCSHRPSPFVFRSRLPLDFTLEIRSYLPFGIQPTDFESFSEWNKLGFDLTAVLSDFIDKAYFFQEVSPHVLDADR